MINNSLVENFELVISNDDNNSSKEFKVSNDDDTVSKSAQNSLPWVLPDKYITDRLTIQLILSLLTLFSLFLPSMNISLLISCVKYIPLLCWIWPGFIQKSSLFYQQSLGMIQTCVPIFLKSPYSLGDKIRATVQLITYTVPQNCLSLFTIHCNSQFTFKTFSYFWPSLAVELLIFLVEGRHMSKIQLGANVRYRTSYTYRIVHLPLSLPVVSDLPLGSK